MTAKVINLQPSVDLAEVYLAYVDSDPDIDLNDPRLTAVMDAMSQEEARRVHAQLLADVEIRMRRAKALDSWRRRPVLQRDPTVLQEIAPPIRTPAMLRVVGDFLELDGDRIAKLLPLRLSLRDRLMEGLDDAEDALTSTAVEKTR
jgi:hypothetical protein